MDLGRMLGGIDKDGIRDAIELITKNKDVLANLPQLVKSLAGGLTDAGEQARAAGLALVGDDARSGATARLDSSAKTIGSIADNLASVAKFVTDAAEDLDKVPMMGGSAKKLVSAAEQVTGATGALGGLSDDLVALAGILAQVGEALSRLGDSLDQSGTEAKGFMGPA